MERDFSFGGDSLESRFGHTITPIGKQRAIIFGGAVGDSGNKYTITGDTYLCEYVHKKFKKLENRGTAPTNRAAHSSFLVDNSLFIFGGALGGGELADDNLYELEITGITDKAVWRVRDCKRTTPGMRYGHVMGYIKPYLIVHGGNIGSQSVGDVWVNDVFNSCQWRRVDTGMDNPPPRVYHSASICKTGTANGMMVIFGGRGADGQPLSDTWGLRKHKDGRLDWMRAPYRNTTVRPAQRYQHRTIFIGTLFLVIGGRNNNVGQPMNLDIYDTDTSDWHKLLKIDRFRHICFLVDKHIYIHGGFDQQNPTVPTQSIMKLNLHQLFSKDPILFKGLSFELDQDFINHSNVPRRSSKQRQQYASQQSARKSDHRMDIQHHSSSGRKTSAHNNRSIKLCADIIVANYNQEADVKKINIDDLQAENKKIGDINTISSVAKDNYIQSTISYFLNGLLLKSVPLLSYPISKEHIYKIFTKLQSILQTQPTLVRIRAPVKIFGDLHGQFSQLNRLFDAFGAPTDEGPKGDIQSTNYIFLGDVIDRGTRSVQTLLLLFCLKLKFPENVFILRGSHEDQIINRSMGFGDECQQKLKQNIDDPQSFFQRANRMFEKFPIAALVDDNVLCVHGGIGTALISIDEISSIQKPYKINHSPKTRIQRIIYDLIWSDPCRDRQANGSPNPDHDYFKLKTNVKFSDQRADSFCAQNQIVTIIRSGQPIMQGFENRQSLITVFSCSDYGNCGNKSAIISINKNNQFIPMVLGPVSGRDRWMDGLDRKKPQTQEDAQLRSLMVSFTPPK